MSRMDFLKKNSGKCNLERKNNYFCTRKAKLRRKDAGVVDRDGLENRCTLTGTQGSNPCLSASNPATLAGLFCLSLPICPAPWAALPIPTPHTAPLLLHTPARRPFPPRHTTHGRPKIFHSKSPAFVVKNHYLYSLHFILQHIWLPQIPPTSALHYSHRTTNENYLNGLKN